MKGMVAFIVFCSVVLFGTTIQNQHFIKNECNIERKNRPQMVKIPNYKNSWQIQKGCSFPKSHNVSYVMRLFYSNWKDRFGDDDGEVLENLNKIVITWEDKKKVITGIGFDVNGRPLSGKARGLTLMPSYIWIWTNPQYKRIAATALVHELVHAALWTINKSHGDPDHEGNGFQGWTKKHTEFIDDINRILAHKDI